MMDFQVPDLSVSMSDDLSWLLATAAPPPQPQPPPATISEISSATAPSAQHTMPKRLPSCAPCRLRRVACRREPGDASCTSCLARQLVCTAMPPKEKKKGQTRAGKRIVQARALFGAASRSTPATSSSSSSDSQSPRDWAVDLLPSSQGARLSSTEVQGAVASSLIEFYLLTQPTVALVEDTGFRMTFELAGRRLDQLDDISQALYSCVLALAARVSDHPALIGNCTMRIGGLKEAARVGLDLREPGRNREAACQQLAAQAIKTVEEKGALKTASMESIATLMLVEGLLDQRDLALSSARPYIVSANGHARALLAAGSTTSFVQKKRIAGSTLGWTAYVRDALMSANSGQSPTFSEDDVYLMRDEENNTEIIPLAQAISQKSNDAVHHFWTLLVAFMHHVADLARETSSKLTGIRARKAPHINEEFVADYLSRVDAAVAAIPELQRRAQVFKAQPNGHPQGTSVDFVVRSLSVSFYNQIFLLNRVVVQRLSARKQPSGARIHEISEWPVIAGPDGDEAYWERLEEIRKQTASRSFASSRALARVLGEATAEGVSLATHDWLDLRGIQMLFARLPVWGSALVDTPAAEEGGPADFTFADKLTEMSHLLHGMFSVAWAFPRLASPVEWIQSEIENTKQRQAAYWVHVAQGGSAFPAAAQPSKDFFGAFSLPQPPPTTRLWTDSELETLLNEAASQMDQPSLYDPILAGGVGVGFGPGGLVDDSWLYQ